MVKNENDRQRKSKKVTVQRKTINRSVVEEYQCQKQ